MPFTPLFGYAPDADTTRPGVITDCSALVPSQRGYEGAPSFVVTEQPALASQCYGAAVLRKTDNTQRLFAATSTHLYEAGDATWTPRSATLTAVTGTDRYRWAQFGDVSLVSSINTQIQSINDATDFAAVTAVAPKAAIIETANNFVLAFDIVDTGGLFWGTDTAHRDGWWCSAQGNEASWAPDVDTQAATNRLKSTPGSITAAKRFGYQVIAYKQASMYIGTYVGGAIIWDWQLVPGNAGALCQEVVVDVGKPDAPQHIFMGVDNFYSYRGGQPIPIGEPVNDTVFADLNTQYAAACIAMHDFKNKRVYFYYPVQAANTPEKCVVYNYVTNQWGRDDNEIEMACQYAAPGITYAELGALYPTYNDFTTATYNLAFLALGQEVPAVFKTDQLLYSVTGTTGTSTLTTGDVGDEAVQSDLKSVAPRMITKPTTASVTNYYRTNLGDALTTDQTTTITNGRFDFMRSAPWHRLKFTFTGNVEISGYTLNIAPDGVVE